MTPQETGVSVRKTITVEAPQDRAFTVFTAHMSTWWPLDTHHIGTQPAADAVMEPREGGRWYERAADGSECDWGCVLAWEPPSRVVLAWQLDADWKYDPDPARQSELEVRFIATGPSTTRVELEHSLLERHGERAEEVRASIDSPEGWGGLLERYAEAARSR
jgi:uncharacterized protein YndB with AHSA1/START domain